MWHLRLSIWILHLCVSCGYSSKFMAQERVSVNLWWAELVLEIN